MRHLVTRADELLSLSHQVFTIVVTTFMVLVVAACLKFGGYWLLKETIG
jgi:hypothetical protein